MKRTFVIVLAAAALTWFGGPSARAAYPDRPIHYILHVSPGGATDVMARKLGSVLQKILHVPIVIENRPGGRVAAQMVLLTHAKPDGYTIGSVTSTHLAVFLQSLHQYNVNSVSWIAELGSEPYIFVVRKGSHIHDMSDLAKAIRADAGKIDIAGFVKGSGSYIAWEMFLAAAHLSDKDANWVPYNSVADGVTAVLGGHGAATVAYVDLVKGEVAAGNLRIIGVMAAKRLTSYPEVPTLAEQGFKVPASWKQWRGVIGPPGIPTPIQAKLADAIHQAMETQDIQTFLQHASVEYEFLGPKEFTAFAHDQDAITAEWMKKLGIIP